MSEFVVPVKIIKDDVLDLPNSDKLSIVKIEGYLCIQAKNEDGTHLYKKGDKVVYIPEAAVVPEWVLKKLRLWNDETKKGVLSGGAGNIVKAKRLRGTFSQGLLYPIKDNKMELENGKLIPVTVDMDVSQYLTIEKFEAPIPKAMSGDQINLQKYTMKFDFENYQSRPNIFTPGDEVYATEKIHGTCFCIGYIPDLMNASLINGNIYASSKGVNGKGLVFKNQKIVSPNWVKYIPFQKMKKFVRSKLEKTVPCNEANLYQNMLRSMMTNGFLEWLQKIEIKYAAKTIHVFAEIYGKGIQDLDYGASTPSVRIFSIAVNNNFLPYADLKAAMDECSCAEMVPVLYVGPFDEATLIKFRDGKTTLDSTSNGALGKKHLREGIVVTSTTEEAHVRYGRKIAKMISPDYLTRKNPDATEHQ